MKESKKSKREPERIDVIVLLLYFYLSIRTMLPASTSTRPGTAAFAGDYYCRAAASSSSRRRASSLLLLLAAARLLAPLVDVLLQLDAVEHHGQAVPLPAYLPRQLALLLVQALQRLQERRLLVDGLLAHVGNERLHSDERHRVDGLGMRGHGGAALVALACVHARVPEDLLELLQLGPWCSSS